MKTSHSYAFVSTAAIAASFAVALAAVSCTGSGGSTATAGGDATVAPTPLPCDVNAVVVAHCQSCHSNPPQSGAPMPLVTWEDFRAVAPNVSGSNPNGLTSYALGDQRIHSTTARMPQPPNAPLSAADLATMDAWTAAGAPAATAATSCAGDAGVAIPDAALPAVACDQNNVTIAPASAWTMPQSETDQYVCYSVSLPVDDDAGTHHVMAITPNIVNKTIVHHVLLFQADPSDTSITSTPQPCSAGGAITWRIVYGWAPGGGAMQTPPDVGFPYDSKTKWVVQVHYNNGRGLSGETDTSGFSFCSTDQPVKYDSDVVAFGTQNIQIPAYSALDETCTITVPPLFSGIHLFAAFPHMHLLGTGIQTEQSLAGGGRVGLAENAPWDFNAQIWFPVDATLNLGDVVSTRCAWQNDTGSEVTFGQNTENEMCYSFTAYYPRVTSPSWSWALPALGSSCAPSQDGGLTAPDAGWSTGGGFGTYEDAGASTDGSGAGVSEGG